MNVEEYIIEMLVVNFCYLKINSKYFLLRMKKSVLLVIVYIKYSVDYFEIIKC